jgi:hypothetical protein
LRTDSGPSGRGEALAAIRSFLLYCKANIVVTLFLPYIFLMLEKKGFIICLKKVSRQNYIQNTE